MEEETTHDSESQVGDTSIINTDIAIKKMQEKKPLVRAEFNFVATRQDSHVINLQIR